MCSGQHTSVIIGRAESRLNEWHAEIQLIRIIFPGYSTAQAMHVPSTGSWPGTIRVNPPPDTGPPPDRVRSSERYRDNKVFGKMSMSATRGSTRRSCSIGVTPDSGTFIRHRHIAAASPKFNSADRPAAPMSVLKSD